MTMRRRVLIGLIVTVGVAFLLGFTASRGILGSHGWAVALIVGAAFCAAIAVALAPLDRRRTSARRLHLLRR
jgi:drug/metabolite transporter (DMT)-like permease